MQYGILQPVNESARVAEEESDRDLVVALLVLDALLVEPPLDRGALLVGNAHGGVRTGSASLVEGEAGRPDVRHHRMALLLDDSRVEDALVERGGRVGVRRLRCRVVDAWHRCQ